MILCECPSLPSQEVLVTVEQRQATHAHVPPEFLTGEVHGHSTMGAFYHERWGFGTAWDVVIVTGANPFEKKCSPTICPS